eukprot:4247960-Pyramimonas_sp.AAC.3
MPMCKLQLRNSHNCPTEPIIAPYSHATIYGKPKRPVRYIIYAHLCTVDAVELGVELTVKTLSSHRITGEFNPPVNLIVYGHHISVSSPSHSQRVLPDGLNVRTDGTHRFDWLGWIGLDLIRWVGLWTGACLPGGATFILPTLLTNQFVSRLDDHDAPSMPAEWQAVDDITNINGVVGSLLGDLGVPPVCWEADRTVRTKIVDRGRHGHASPVKETGEI